MAWTHIGTSGANGARAFSNITVSMDAPAGVAAGDLLVAMVWGSNLPSSISGWTTAGGPTSSGAVFYCSASGGTDTISVALTSFGQFSVMAMTCWRPDVTFTVDMGSCSRTAFSNVTNVNTSSISNPDNALAIVALHHEDMDTGTGDGTLSQVTSSGSYTKDVERYHNVNVSTVTLLSRSVSTAGTIAASTVTFTTASFEGVYSPLVFSYSIPNRRRRTEII